jgi:predicted nucleic acid-binding Zn ribbon protein
MAKPTVTEVKTQIDTHEAICAERWQETINRIKRLEMIIIGSGGAIILLLINIIVFGD